MAQKWEIVHANGHVIASQPVARPTLRIWNEMQSGWRLILQNESILQAYVFVAIPIKEKGEVPKNTEIWGKQVVTGFHDFYKRELRVVLCCNPFPAGNWSQCMELFIRAGVSIKRRYLYTWENRFTDCLQRRWNCSFSGTVRESDVFGIYDAFCSIGTEGHGLFYLLISFPSSKKCLFH